MANDEHIKLLRQGTAVWNANRPEVPDFIDACLSSSIKSATVGRISLSIPGADLSHAQLGGARLYAANLQGAQLQEANLSQARLEKVNLSEANLTEANLANAYMPHANLTGANLTNTNFTGANLSGANLSHAIMTCADFSESRLDDADLTGADLREAKLNFAHASKALLLNTVLTDANMYRIVLTEADLSGANFTHANLMGADLSKTKLCGCSMARAYLTDAKFVGADLTGQKTDMSGAFMDGVDLSDADLRDANLSDACLRGAVLVNTSIEGTILNGAQIYGISAWDLIGHPAESRDLVITPPRGSGTPITVDQLEVAQFVYLLLNNKELKRVIDTIGQRGVLILGRFTERKNFLEVIRRGVRDLGFLPMVFDFERPTSLDFTETVKTLAGLSAFIIADITAPKSVGKELEATVPDYMVPLVPFIQRGEKPFSMFSDLRNKYDWVLDVVEYCDAQQLAELIEPMAAQAWDKRKSLVERKAQELTVLTGESVIRMYREQEKSFRR